MVPVPVRLAGALVGLLGVANALLGVLSTTTDLLALTPGSAGALVVTGVVLVALAAVIWRGGRYGIIGALTTFAFLLVLQLGELSSSATPVGVPARTAILVVLIAVLGWALRSLGRRATTRPGDGQPGG